MLDKHRLFHMMMKIFCGVMAFLDLHPLNNWFKLYYFKLVFIVHLELVENIVTCSLLASIVSFVSSSKMGNIMCSTQKI